MRWAAVVVILSRTRTFTQHHHRRMDDPRRTWVTFALPCLHEDVVHQDHGAHHVRVGLVASAVTSRKALPAGVT
jgi:hypothetical protein